MSILKQLISISAAIQMIHSSIKLIPDGLDRIQMGLTETESVTYLGKEVKSPKNLEELRNIIFQNPKFRVLGLNHSFSSMNTTEGVYISLSNFKEIESHDQTTIYVGAGVTFKELADELQKKDKAIRNLPSNPHANVIEAITTGSFGADYHQGIMANMVVEFSMLRSDGQFRTFIKNDPQFQSILIGFGYLGVITGVRLNIEASFTVMKCIYENLSTLMFTRRFNFMFYGPDYAWFYYDINEDNFRSVHFVYSDSQAFKKESKNLILGSL